MIVGFIAGAFDVIHPGYIQMFKEAKEYCDHLVVGLHKDPENNGKLRPVLSIEDRREILKSLIYVGDVFIYEGEEGLYQLLKQVDPDVRFLGSDYIGKEITGEDLNIQTVFLSREHGWSTTKFKNLIYQQLNGKNIQ